MVMGVPRMAWMPMAMLSEWLGCLTGGMYCPTCASIHTWCSSSGMIQLKIQLELGTGYGSSESGCGCWRACERGYVCGGEYMCVPC